MTAGTNYSVRDEIRDYWSTRAETFDLSPGHEIFSEAERAAWHRLIVRHLGQGEGRRALDLACGTGVVSHVMHDLKYDVTGLDWSEAMLGKAREKSKLRGSKIRFLMRDAETTGEDAGSYDVIVTRHLVWTLVDPAAAFAHWFSLLKPGGKVLIIDGDFVTQTWFRRLRRAIESGVALFRKPPADPRAEFRTQYKSIMSQIYFRDGARSPEVVRLLEGAGFEPIVVDTSLGDIHRAQASKMPIAQFLDRATQHRYAICASKPL
jgi:ubiquinone/menaquinone biosynthesis C-methylase UbiE